jgi:acyl-CoA dehydrogenase
MLRCAGYRQHGVLARYGTPEQKSKWLTLLLEGKTRSCFAMTEPAVASSGATNIQATIRREGDHYVINGHKWFSSGAGDPRCALFILMGKTDPDHPDKHKQQSMIIVPTRQPGISAVRPLPVFLFCKIDKVAEVIFENVRVPATNMLLGEGGGFENSQGRLGPGRIHHCMRLIGLAERALASMCVRDKG